HRGTTCGHRGDAGKRTASGPKERSVEPLALPIRARFVPLPGHPDCSSDWCMPRIPGGRFCAVPLAMGGGLALFVSSAGAGCRIGSRRPVEAAAEAVTGERRDKPAWRRDMKTSCIEGVAIHGDLGSCAGVREDAGEALTEGDVGWV